MMENEIKILGRSIGPGHPVYIVAELSANHGQKFEQAAELIRQAHAAGADAVKLQTYTAETLTIDSDREWFRIGNTSLWAGRTLYDLYKEAFTPWEWQPKLKKIADELGLPLFSSPFDFSAVDFLESMNVPAYKIASFELVDLPLIKRVAVTGKPMIMSTGMATISEIDEAVSTARAAGANELALLKCTSGYPARPEEMNLRTIPHLSATFNVPVGLSDHTLGVTVPVAAVSLGAAIVEKHFTLSRTDAGPDSAFSLEPAEFTAMVDAIRTTEQALGGVHYGATDHEFHNLRFRRSLFITRDVSAGTLLTVENLRSIRPATGLHPRHYEEVLGRRMAKDVEKGTPLTWDLIR
jgi:pseudaminic acid synthase